MAGAAMASSAAPPAAVRKPWELLPPEKKRKTGADSGDSDFDDSSSDESDVAGEVGGAAEELRRKKQMLVASAEYKAMGAQERFNRLKELQVEHRRAMDKVRKSNNAAASRQQIEDETCDGQLVPRPLAQLSVMEPTAILKVGMRFGSICSLNLRVQELAQRQNIKPRYTGNAKGMRACKTASELLVRAAHAKVSPEGDAEDDSFLVHARHVDGVWDVLRVRAGPRVLHAGGKTSPMYVIAYEVAVLAPFVYREVLENCVVPASRIRSLLVHIVGQGAVGVDPVSKTFVHCGKFDMVRKLAQATMIGDMRTNATRMPALVSALHDAGHYARFETATRAEMETQIAVRARAEHAVQQRDLAVEERVDFDAQGWFEENEEKLRDILGPDDALFVSGLFIGLGPHVAAAADGHLLDLYVTDAAHTGSCWFLYTVVGLNANNNLVPIAYALVVGYETYETWRKVLAWAKQLVPSLDREGVSIMSDRQKGLAKAVASTFTFAKPLLCAHHRNENLLRGASAEAAKLWRAVAYASTVPDYEAKLRALEAYVDAPEMLAARRKRAKQMFGGMPHAVQFIAARAQQARVYGRTTSQAVESANSSNKRKKGTGGARMLKDMVAATLRLLQDEGSRYTKHAQEARDRIHRLPPNIQIKLAEVETRARSDSAVELHDDAGHGQVRATVRTPNHRMYEVALGAGGGGGGGVESMFGTCSCTRAVLSHFPCTHQVMVARVSNVELARLVPRCFWTCTWAAVYPAATVFKTLSLADIKHGEIDARLRPPVLGITRQGQHGGAARRLSVLERARQRPRRKQVCRRCGDSGHNRARCAQVHAAAAPPAADSDSDEDAGGDSDDDAEEEDDGDAAESFSDGMQDVDDDEY